MQRPLGREYRCPPLLIADVAEVAVVSVQGYDGPWPCTLSANFRKGAYCRLLGESSWLFEQELGLLSTSHSIYQHSESPSTRPSSFPFLKTGVVCAIRSMGTPALATFHGQFWMPCHETRLIMTEP